jgi:hypothetical protein
MTNKQLLEEILFDLQTLYDTDGMTDDEGTPMIYLADAIATVEEYLK